MDRIRRLGKSKSSSDKFTGNQQVHEEKNISKLAPPSLVARLMGLNGLPSQQSICRQQKNFANNNIQRTAPIVSQRDAHLFEDRSYKKSFVEQTEFKDVFEDTVEKSSSNKDLMVELLQQPDSLFVKHMRAVQGVPSSSLCNHLAVANPSESSEHESKAKGWKAEREASKKHDIGSKQINEDHILSHSYSSLSSHNSLKPSKIRADGTDETNVVTTRIVVLKPIYAKSQSARNSFSSPDSSHANLFDCKNDKGYIKDEGCLGKIDFSKDREFSRSNCREARETTKKATREMRKSSGRMMSAREARDAAKKFNREVQEVFDRMMIDYPSCVKELPGTGGLHDFSGIDSASESVVMKMTSYDSTESFISRKAKKRLLERWKMAQRYQDVGVGGKGSTLGEVLSIPDSKIANLDAVMGVDGNRDRFDMKKGTARWDGPLGISSSDGWKDKYSKLSQRSRSLPPPTGSRSDRLNAECDSRVDDKLLMPKEARSQGRNKVATGNFNEKKDFSFKNPRSSRRKSQSFRHRYACNTNSLLESYPSHDQMEIHLEKKDPPENQSIVPQTPNYFNNIVDAAASTEHACINMLTGSSNELPPELSTCMLKYGNTFAVDQEDSNPQESPIGPPERVSIVQCTGAEPQSSESSKEADHPSPVSVLEVLSIEDDVSSGPECFEQVSADLRELRKQLQLLKRESKAYAETPTLIVKSDDDIGQGSTKAGNGKGIVRSECWESSYMVDVLIGSGFNDIDPDMFMTMWHSLDCPLGPWVFDNLEKKYCDEITGLKYERRLLFDCINSAFLEISQSFMDPFPWVRSVTVGFGSKWQKCVVRDEQLKLLAIQEKEANEDISEKQLDKEMHWLDSRDSIDVIGMEIEKLLIDDLIAELVIM